MGKKPAKTAEELFSTGKNIIHELSHVCGRFSEGPDGTLRFSDSQLGDFLFLNIDYPRKISADALNGYVTKAEMVCAEDGECYKAQISMSWVEALGVRHYIAKYTPAPKAEEKDANWREEKAKAMAKLDEYNKIVLPKWTTAITHSVVGKFFSVNKTVLETPPHNVIKKFALQTLFESMFYYKGLLHFGA